MFYDVAYRADRNIALDVDGASGDDGVDCGATIVNGASSSLDGVTFANIIIDKSVVVFLCLALCNSTSCHLISMNTRTFTSCHATHMIIRHMNT